MFSIPTNKIDRNGIGPSRALWNFLKNFREREQNKYTTMMTLSHVLLLLSSVWTTSDAFFLPHQSAVNKRNSRLYYDIQRDNRPNDNVWNVLATTERWISQTLANAKSADGSNPLSRKEVSYVCETSTDAALVLANIFRKLKEARQMGETHGEEQEEFLNQMEDGTLKKTNERSCIDID